MSKNPLLKGLQKQQKKEHTKRDRNKIY